MQELTFLNNDVKITFLIPTFNDEKYIQMTIESILNQSYENWEIMIMDKSTDQTESIIRSFITKYPNKIKYYRQKSIGQLDALLDLVPYITGNYIVLIHSDDFLISNDSIEKNLKMLLKSGADGIYSDLIIVDKMGKYISRRNLFFSIKKLIFSGGSNCIPDHFFLKK